MLLGVGMDVNIRGPMYISCNERQKQSATHAAEGTFGRPNKVYQRTRSAERGKLYGPPKSKSTARRGRQVSQIANASSAACRCARVDYRAT